MTGDQSDTPTESDAGAASPPQRVPQQIGPYRLLGQLGEGGFGVVYLAERREPHVQRVALKVIKPGMDSKAVIARFEQERQALAVMDHPNVAKVLDAGVTDEGRPYFVMEHVKGEPITHYCDRQRLSVKDRLRLFIQVCEAIQHAHTKGVIHRDIKPSNILLSSAPEGAGDSIGIPKVIDFGVAKAINQTLTEKTIFTEQGQLIGTPEYMSPEQAEMGATDVDTRTDVYSLGVLLYELLTGALPFDAEELRSKGYNEIQRIIREVDPPRPSTRLSSLGDSARTTAASRRSRVDDLAGQLRRELEWIPLYAMRKVREERYQSPLDLAEDVRRYIEGEPLVAGPESTVYRLRKHLLRNRLALLSALAACLVVASLIVATLAISRSKRLNAAAQLAADRQQELELSLMPLARVEAGEMISDRTEGARRLIDRIIHGEAAPTDSLVLFDLLFDARLDLPSVAEFDNRTWSFSVTEKKRESQLDAGVVIVADSYIDGHTAIDDRSVEAYASDSFLIYSLRGIDTGGSMGFFSTLPEDLPPGVHDITVRIRYALIERSVFDEWFATINETTIPLSMMTTSNHVSSLPETTFLTGTVFRRTVHRLDRDSRLHAEVIDPSLAADVARIVEETFGARIGDSTQQTIDLEWEWPVRSTPAGFEIAVRASSDEDALASYMVQGTAVSRLASGGGYSMQNRDGSRARASFGLSFGDGNALPESLIVSLSPISSDAPFSLATGKWPFVNVMHEFVVPVHPLAD